MSYPTRPQSHQQRTEPLPTEFKEIRGLQKALAHKLEQRYLQLT